MSSKINKLNIDDVKQSAKSLDTFDLWALNSLVKQNYKNANNLYELMNLTYHQHLQQDLNHFEELDYMTTKDNERKYLEKEYFSKAVPLDKIQVNDYTLKEKLKYYSKRVDDPKLTIGQRKYAQEFINKYNKR